jgi:hypothetical protein
VVTSDFDENVRKGAQHGFEEFVVPEHCWLGPDAGCGNVGLHLGSVHSKLPIPEGWVTFCQAWSGVCSHELGEVTLTRGSLEKI